jgi:GT2 family glycosyltransferase
LNYLILPIVQPIPPVIFVCATRAKPEEFAATPTGQSIARIRFSGRIKLALAADNRAGLPSVYNRVIQESFRDHILVFIHDDVWIDDVFFVNHLMAGLREYDVVGLAGNRRLLPEAPAWSFKNDQMEWDKGNLSGVVCHGPKPWGAPSLYGPVPAGVELLDGVLLAAKCSTLLDAGVRFDERFGFHFYDLDFSRSARQAGLNLGTFATGITHVSGGSFGSPSWRAGLAKYRQKWLGATTKAMP